MKIKLTVCDMHQIADFHRVVKNYLKICRLEQKQIGKVS